MIQWIFLEFIVLVVVLDDEIGLCGRILCERKILFGFLTSDMQED
jgi:hypothetical protein